jgi:hypothetical protein
MAVSYHSSLSSFVDHGYDFDAHATWDITSNTDRRDVSEMLDLLAIADTPFINRIGWGPDSGSQSIEWLSENLGPGYVEVGSATGSASTSQIITYTAGLTLAEAVKQLQTGTIVYHYSSTDGEHCMFALISVGADGVCEFETISATGAGWISGAGTSRIVGDKLYILGAMANEGSWPRAGNPRARTLNSNAYTIFRQDVNITGSEKANDFYAIGREDKHQIMMRLKEMQREREKSALYSGQVTRSATVAGLMNGALGFLMAQSGTNIDTSTTALTENAVNAVVSECWENGANNLTWFSDINQAAKFTRWDKQRIRMGPRDKRGGGQVTYYLTECGLEIEIVPMKKKPTNIAFLIDTSKCAMRAKKGRKGFMEKLGKQGDFDMWQIISECSLEMKGYNLGQHGLFTRLA